jgi:hypothetical protein
MVVCSVCRHKVYPAEELQYQGKVSLLILMIVKLPDKLIYRSLFSQEGIYKKKTQLLLVLHNDRKVTLADSFNIKL